MQKHEWNQGGSGIEREIILRFYDDSEFIKSDHTPIRAFEWATFMGNVILEPFTCSPEAVKGC